MAIYSLSSGIESQTVGQYSDYVLSNLATRQIQSFTKADARGLFGFISSEESVSYCYEPSVIDRYVELDYGLITVNHTTSINNGSITEKNRTLEDYGRIYYVTNVESFGFVKVVDGASWKATQAYQGSGNLGLFGKEQSPAFYNWITDGKVRIFGKRILRSLLSSMAGEDPPFMATVPLESLLSLVVVEIYLRYQALPKEILTTIPQRKEVWVFLETHMDLTLRSTRIRYRRNSIRTCWRRERENSSSIMDLELSIFWQENQKNIDYQNLQITLLEFILVWMQIYHLVRLNSIKDIPTLVAFY